jgi:transcriptional regulator with XRE-family HTH domain
MIDNNLKDCREELEMTQKELGFVFGVSKNTVSGWENGHDTMPFNKLIRFCNLYDYSLDYAIGFIRRNIKYDKIKTNKNKIGKKLKEIRNELNLTQTKLSEQCSISQSTYSAYESGKYLINTLTIYTICMKYNISMDYIVGRSNKKNIL